MAAQEQQFVVPMLPANYANQRMMAPPISTTTSSQSAPSTSSGQFAVPMTSQQAAVIRRRRFSCAKIQPTRIKKVMQSDEEIGRMVQSVPVSIGRSMEHFAEKFLQAASEATLFTNSKTLTPQHMKQAMLANPHFQFLDTILKDIAAPTIPVENTTARIAMSLKEQQQLEEQQNNEIALSIIANSRLQLQQMQEQNAPDTPQSPYMMNIQSPQTLLPNGVTAPIFPNLQKNVAAAAVPGAPITPTTQLVDMISFLNTSNNVVGPQVGTKPTRAKRMSVDTEGDDDKPKRGRPKKKKAEKCIDDALFEEASKNIAKEDKDRELMPPPALPIGRL